MSRKYRVLSSTKNENGTLTWSVSVWLESFDDARNLARTLANATKREAQVVEEVGQVNYINPCGGCFHLEFGACPGKGQPCEDFKRFK